MANKDVNYRSKLLSEKISESIHVADHDPSMALYRLQEHIHKASPALINAKYSNFRANAAIQSSCCDLDSSKETLEQMKVASATFDRVHDLLKNAMFYKQQLNYENSRATEAKEQ
ncbi:unnamed protein product [Bursaphelenchus xylophilus]|uniref:(pine wood nematode) hypothetical protein n=1 Tax=Bursaphelenchus xylophilus TaxID=6326 RepID=A0A1I7S0D4_BURXY|nr:unnamed protein product [Bursaphelenchus xylophilus]CAG9132217.1 unnamed protein product [Bursaphelenchus xylophilus]